VDQAARSLIVGQRVRQELQKLSEQEKSRIRSGKKHYLGHETWEGWSGALPIYLFWCGECQNYTLDYPHGFIQSQYLLCHRCDTRLDFVPWWIVWSELLALLRISWRYRNPPR
jgi:hypothetical protein